jgi:glutathione S-transferase
MARYTLHGIFASGPAYKVGLMLNLTGTPFNYTHVDLRAGEHKSDAYRDLNRFGVVPALEDHQAGLTLCESSAILDYLADETGQFGGTSRADRLRAREWQLWGAGGLTNGVYRTRGMKRGFIQFPEQVAELYLQSALTSLKQLDALIGTKDWLVGNGPTIADIDLYGIAAFAGEAGIDLAPMPALRGWLGRVEALPGFKGVRDCLPMQSRAA